MKIRITEPADEDYDTLPPKIQIRIDKQLDLLAQNLRHPSIKAKKYNESQDLWQGRINKAYRFYFKIVGDTYLILAFTEHPK
jgi:mRNA-degrading endonuclease RelE of RelBE toxin-antitoxin system